MLFDEGLAPWRLRALVLVASAFLMAGSSTRQAARVPVDNRTMTYWAAASDPVVHGRPSCGFPPCANWSEGSKDWEDRLALLAKHRDNFTGMIPCIHAVVDGGKLGLNGDGSYHAFLPYLPKLKAMGLEITAFLGNAGHTGGKLPALEAMIKRGPSFIAESVAMALKNGYNGFAIDHELHCNLDSDCWAKMEPLAKPWVTFLNQFADELHKHSMILSVFIDGCCGYTNPYDTGNRGCKGVEANRDYQGAQCTDFTNSSVDR